MDNGHRLWVGAQNGTTYVSVSIKDTTNLIRVGDYELKNNLFNSGGYSRDLKEYQTDAANTGLLSVTAIDRTRHTISGTFYFKARNAATGKVVDVSDGAFNGVYYEF